MKRNYQLHLIFLAALVFFSVCGIRYMKEESRFSRLNPRIVTTGGFRAQNLDPEVLEQAGLMESPGEAVGVYLLESLFGREQISLQNALKNKQRWERQRDWEGYASQCRAIWDDLRYFPVALISPDSREEVSFENSWLYERSYKGERGHEGTDLMPKKKERGLYPVVSMTDGVVANIGWLELGGYRIGIAAPSGGYFYYAHLDSYADLKEGDRVKAGDFLGYMGDTGYGPEGTRGKFPVHLHVGIYLNTEEGEISVNPYGPLTYLKNKRVQGK